MPMTPRPGPRCAGDEGSKPLVKEPSVADLVFVVITVVLFAALAVLIRTVERW
jgi:hypothetical protein